MSYSDPYDDALTKDFRTKDFRWWDADYRKDDLIGALSPRRVDSYGHVACVSFDGGKPEGHQYRATHHPRGKGGRKLDRALGIFVSAQDAKRVCEQAVLADRSGETSP